MKRIKFIIIIVVAVALIAGLVSLLTGGHSQTAYRTDKITRGAITNVVTASGTINPIELVTVGSQASGQIQHVYVNVNDHVKKGQLLADIDPSLADSTLKQSVAALETARVGYEQAQRDLERTRMLLQKDYVAKVDLEHAEQAYLGARNGYDSAKAQVDQNKVNLSYTKITSPIDGEVVSQSVTSGQTLAATLQTPDMFKIASDLAKMKIDVNLSEADVSKVKVGMPTTFTVDAFPDRNFPGKVQTVNLNPNNQQGVVTYTTVITVDNKDRVLFPGMTANVSITLSEVKDVLRVPASALRFEPPPEQVSGLRRLFQTDSGPGYSFGSRTNDDTKTLYLLRSGNPFPVTVKTGATDETNVEISGDAIKEGDIVITGIQPQRGRSPMPYVIAMEDVCKDYTLAGGQKVRVLKSVDLTIEPGEFVAIMGPSGSGKSTLMNLLGTLDRPTEGLYLLDEEDVSRCDDAKLAAARNRTIGFVFQGFNLLPRRTIIDNIALPLFYAGEKRAERIRRAEYYLNEVGLASHRDYYPGQLSGGQQQRIAIARALCGEPKLILADEPTGNLDSKTSTEIMDMFTELNREGITIVLVTHEQDIARYGKRLVQVKDGEIVYDGPMY